jgi:polar amino acid transport system permease protein
VTSSIKSLPRISPVSDAAPQEPSAARSGPSRQKRPTRLSWVDYILLLVLGAGILWIAYRIQAGLDYRWNWRVVLDFTIRTNPNTGNLEPNLLLIGFFMTVRIVLWASVLALVIGVAIGLCRSSSIVFLQLLARAYVDLIRGIPPLVIIFVFFYFVTSQIIPHLGIEQALRTSSPVTAAVVELFLGPPRLVPAFISATICLALFEAAYVAEIVRAGIESVERGQWEASRSLGLSWFDSMRDVVLPQAFQRMLPPLAGQFISLIKDSSIASLISVQELAFMAAQVSASTYRIFEVWISVAAVYFVMCFGLSWFFSHIEQRTRKRL